VVQASERIHRSFLSNCQKKLLLATGVPGATLARLASNPFALLSLVGAPAVLTNAASVLALSTSNRFLRATERMRSFAAEIEQKKAFPDVQALLLTQIDRTENQARLLLGALRGAYVAAGAFTAATLVSIVGAALAPHAPRMEVGIAVVALAIGVLGAGALVQACQSQRLLSVRVPSSWRRPRGRKRRPRRPVRQGERSVITSG
jgi:Protein of unknown function (DUF2721)